VNKAAVSHVDPRGINAQGAKIIGNLDLASVSIPFPLTMVNCFFVEVPDFSNAEIRGLILDQSFAPGITAARLTVSGDFSLQGFRSDGAAIRIERCHLKGDLNCAGATLSNPDRRTEQGDLDEGSGTTISGDDAVIDGNAFLWRSFTSEGEVRLLGAQIGGDIECGGASITHPASTKYAERGLALNAERVIVKGSIFLRNGFQSRGDVRLVDAQIGGSLALEGGRFENLGASGSNHEAPALTLDRVSVRGTSYFGVSSDSKPFEVVGRFSLVDARLSSVLVMDGAHLQDATVDLSGTTTAGLSDDGEFTWPSPSRLHLRRFVYEAIVGGTEDPRYRLEWLALQPDDDFNTESYAHLAKVLLDGGDDDGSRLVLKTMAEILRKRGHPHWYLSPLSWSEAAIGYGYNPTYSIGYSAVLGLIGWVIYRRSYLAGTLVPSDKDAYMELREKGTIPPHYPRLSSFMMSVENSLPLVKLGQSDKWQPDPSSRQNAGRDAEKQEGDAATSDALRRFSRADLLMPFRPATISKVAYRVGLQPGPLGLSSKGALSRTGTSPRFVRRFIWLQILLGWLFATLFVAGVTGLIKR